MIFLGHHTPGSRNNIVYCYTNSWSELHNQRVNPTSYNRARQIFTCTNTNRIIKTQ